MDLRSYLQVVRRRRVIIIAAVVVCLALGALAQLRKTPMYEASAQVLLQPRDPAERVTPDPGGFFDPDRYAADQVSIMTSPAVLDKVSQSTGVSADDAKSAVTIDAEQGSDTLTVTAVFDDKTKARDLANSVIESYIENKKTTAQESLQTAADGLQTTLDQLGERIGELQAQLRDRSTTISSAASANLSSAVTQYGTLSQQQRNLLTDLQLKKGEAQMVSPAKLPKVPSGLGLPVSLILAGLVGLMVGLGLAFLREHLDDRIRSREELEDLTGLPVIGELPRDRRSAKRDHYVATSAEPNGSLAEATRSLRTNITFLGLDRSIGRLLVTSAMPGEGKTLVSANIATAFAQAGVRTLLISGDLRRPRVESLFAISTGGRGLTEVLAETPGLPALDRWSEDPGIRDLLRRSVDDVLVQTKTENLMVLPAGVCPPNPAEVLGSSRMDQLLDVLEEQFELIVVDASPLLAVTDAAVFAPKVGNVLLVASMTSSRRRALARMTAVIAPTPARVLGIVANRSTLEKGAFAPYYDDVRPSGSGRGGAGKGGSGSGSSSILPGSRDEELGEPSREPLQRPQGHSSVTPGA